MKKIVLPAVLTMAYGICNAEVPNVFEAGDVATAEAFNQNFQYLEGQVQVIKQQLPNTDQQLSVITYAPKILVAGEAVVLNLTNIENGIDEDIQYEIKVFNFLNDDKSKVVQVLAPSFFAGDSENYGKIIHSTSVNEFIFNITTSCWFKSEYKTNNTNQYVKTCGFGAHAVIHGVDHAITYSNRYSLSSIDNLIDHIVVTVKDTTPAEYPEDRRVVTQAEIASLAADFGLSVSEIKELVDIVDGDITYLDLYEVLEMDFGTPSPSLETD